MFSAQEGGESYSKDLPDSEIQRHNSDHFPVEGCLDEIATKVHRFYLEREKKPT